MYFLYLFCLICFFIGFSTGAAPNLLSTDHRRLNGSLVTYSSMSPEGGGSRCDLDSYPWNNSEATNKEKENSSVNSGKWNNEKVIDESSCNGSSSSVNTETSVLLLPEESTNVSFVGESTGLSLKRRSDQDQTKHKPKDSSDGSTMAHFPFSDSTSTDSPYRELKPGFYVLHMVQNPNAEKDYIFTPKKKLKHSIQSNSQSRTLKKVIAFGLILSLIITAIVLYYILSKEKKVGRCGNMLYALLEPQNATKLL